METHAIGVLPAHDMTGKGYNCIASLCPGRTGQKPRCGTAVPGLYNIGANTPRGIDKEDGGSILHAAATATVS